jgi:GTP-binding protein LepA
VVLHRLDYNFVRFESSSLVKVDVLINGEKLMPWQ